MNIQVNSMETITKDVLNITLQHYVLKKNRYNRHFFIGILMSVGTKSSSVIVSIYHVAYC